MSKNTQQMTKILLEEKLNIKPDNLLIPKKFYKTSKSPDFINTIKRKNQIEMNNRNKLQTSMTNLNKSNISVQKIIFNKKHYEKYMLQKKYLLSKTQYHKLICIIREIEEKLKENNENIEKINITLNELKETKKKKKEEIIELLSNKESLEIIYQNKINSFYNNDQKIIKEKIDNINGHNINRDNINDNAEEQTNPNTNDSNNSNDENKNNENDNENHKKKESSSSSLSSDNPNLIEIKFDEIKISDPKKYEEQVNSFVEQFLQKKDNELSMKLIKKVNLSYQYFNTETNVSENDNKNSINNFFSRISLFIANQSLGNISEKLVNSFLRDLMKINSIGEEISEILFFLNKKYKDSKKEMKGKIKNLSESNENLIMKKKSYEAKKEELKQFLEENKDKYNNEKNKIYLKDNKILYTSFISDGNNTISRRILCSNKSHSIKNPLRIKKINFSSLNKSKNKANGLGNNEKEDLNVSKDVNENIERRIVDNLNKYLINSLQIKKNRNNRNKEASFEKVNKKIFLHKTSFSKSGTSICNLLNNNMDKNEESINKINENKNNLFNNSEIINNNNGQSPMNNKRISTKIIYRNSKLKLGKKINSVFLGNNSNLQDLISAQKKPSISKIILLKDMKSISFRNLKNLKSPLKITQTHRHNDIFFQREELKTETYSRSPDSNNRFNNKENNIAYPGKVIPFNKDKKIEISRIDKSNIYSTRYDNRLKLLTKGIKESYCHFKFYRENHLEYNPLDELLQTPENLDYVEGYISIDVFLHKFKIIPKIYKNKKITFEQLVDNYGKDMNISELNSEFDKEFNDGSYLGIELKDIIDITLTKRNERYS